MLMIINVYLTYINIYETLLTIIKAAEAFRPQVAQICFTHTTRVHNSMLAVCWQLVVRYFAVPSFLTPILSIVLKQYFVTHYKQNCGRIWVDFSTLRSLKKWFSCGKVFIFEVFRFFI